MAFHSKPGPLVVEPPKELRFPGPLLSSSLTKVKLFNKTDNRIAYRIKTTAPNFYGVRPTSGVIKPRDMAEVQIARKPFTHQSLKLNHKFMIQSLVVPDVIQDVSKLWQYTDPKQWGITKLRCIFEGSAHVASRANSKEMISLNEFTIFKRRGNPHKLPTKLTDEEKMHYRATSSSIRKPLSGRNNATLSRTGSKQSDSRRPTEESGNGNINRPSGSPKTKRCRESARNSSIDTLEMEQANSRQEQEKIFVA